MKLEAFETLQAVLQTGTLAAAAKQRHLTPSAVSLQMKQIESYLGQQLFDRSGVEVRPLPCAFEAAEAVQQALARLARLRRTMPSTIEGSVRVGIIESLQPRLLPPLMRRLRERYPRLLVLPTRGRSVSLTDAVKAGDLDAAVVAQPETGGSSRLHWQPLMSQALVLVAPPQVAPAPPAALFRRHPWIAYDRRTIAGRLAARYAKRHLDAREPILELDGARAIIAMVQAGLGLSIVQLAEPGILRAFPVQTVPLPEAPTIRFALVTRKTDAEHRLLLAVRELLQEAANETESAS